LSGAVVILLAHLVTLLRRGYARRGGKGSEALPVERPASMSRGGGG